MYLSLTIQSVFSKGTEIDKDKQKDGIVSILFDLPLIENAKELLRLNISVSQPRLSWLWPPYPGVEKNFSYFRQCIVAID